MLKAKIKNIVCKATTNLTDNIESKVFQEEFQLNIMTILVYRYPKMKRLRS